MHLLLISTTINKMITAFSWMLIHSLWQGLFLAIVTGAALVLAKRASSAYRYNLALILFMLFIAVCGLTFVYEWQSAAAATVLTPFTGNIGVNASSLFFNVHSVKQLVKTFTDYFSANAPFIILIWFMVFLFKSVKMISCLAYNQRIRNYQVYQPSEFWVNKVNLFSEKLKITKAVKLLQSGYIKVPVVVGHLKPVILMPVGLLAGLPMEQVEAILLHELAHIKRNDYFINFLQNVAEAVFFFNPGLLWISSLLKEERENCCDDIALQQTNNKIELVKALVSFKEHELYGSAYATAFPGKKNYLMRRVVRIMHNKNKTFGRSEKIFFITSILLFGLIVTTAAVARIKEYTKASFKEAAPISKTTVEPTMTVITAIAAKKVRLNKRHGGLPLRSKMINGIAGINKAEAIEVAENVKINRVEPAEAASIKQPEIIKQQADNGSTQAEKDRRNAEQARIQSERDRKEAEQSRMQAMKDQEQARQDRIQAEKDRAQADLDRAQAVKDRAQADKDRAQAVKDRAQAELDRQQFAKNKASVSG
ncbi:M56 family metallopeptidase [Mucilaginibacter sp. OK098]|uniref:M56 family metallopeptidase n=1 Tax=Mucilaginibacter sp. OK098 TaxID=1855297 RepID=UPI0009352C1E|nr:M56 family metallopeptidase [Mucilaginibacter sp. OK098]